MEQKQMARQMMEFNKAAFDNSFSAMWALQDQTHICHLTGAHRTLSEVLLSRIYVL